MKRFNSWDVALRAAQQLATETGRRFRVERSPWPLYGWHWWTVQEVGT